MRLSIVNINKSNSFFDGSSCDIVRNLKDPRARMVTVVDTEVSKDLKYVKMFISVLGTETEQREATAALEKAAGYIRREVAGRVKLRYAPEIQVVYDDTTERAARVLGLISNLEEEGEQ